MDTAPATGWSPTGAVVALKPTEYAKSRLGTLADPLRRRLAWTMALDTLAALGEAVDRLLVVSDQPALESRLTRLGLDVTVVAEPGRVGMNGALRHGSEWLRDAGCRTVVASVGDLPALRPASVRQALTVSRPWPRSFLADATGIGTTMLIAHDAALEPHFQGRSAAAHRASGAVALNAELLGGPLADARRDVDTEVDLFTAVPLGLGRWTGALLDPGTGQLGHYQVLTVTDQHDGAGDQVAITGQGYRVTLPAGALQDGLRHVRLGQRLHAVTSADTVLAAWL